MNIVFHNPHAIWFKTNISCYYAGTKSINKYDFLFDYIYKSNKKVKVLIDNSCKAQLFNGALKFIDTPVIDFYAWVIINRLNPFKFKIVRNARVLRNNDIIFSFLYGTFTNLYNNQVEIRQPFIEDFKYSPAFKVVHLTHFSYSSQQGVLNTELAGIDLFVAENNLFKNSAFFRSLYGWYNRDVVLLPFVAQDRFKSVKNFETRLNKALSTGTNTHQMLDESFLSFFKSNTLQPMRKSIIENSQILENYLHSLNSNIGLHFEKSENHAENKFHIFKMKLISRIKFIFGDPYRLCKLVYHYILQHDFNSLKNEREYYKTNIVDIYNNYKMLIVPEEIIGLPGIGFIEGMFCGSAYIGLRDPMYQDLGLIEGMHYIAYDGSLEDLISKISYYQENENELQRIAANGNDFVMKNFNQEKVAKDFFSNLYELASTNNLKHD